MIRLAPLILLLLVPIGVLAQGALSPPAAGGDPSSYLVYALVAGATLVVTTGGQLLVALVGLWGRSGTSEQARLVQQMHAALHYRDTEGTLRPVMSGETRRESEEARKDTREQLRIQTAILERIAAALEGEPEA